MAYYIFHIPSTTFPIGLTRIKDSIFCFPSKELNTFSDYELHHHCLCLAIDVESDSEAMKIIKDFIIVLNIFHQEDSAIKWFSGLSIKSHAAVNDSIDNIYSQYRTDEKFFGYFDDFNNMPLHLFIPTHPKFSFIEVFNKLSELSESDFVYKSLSFLAIINPVRMFTQRLFDNALLENSMHFQLFESIMNELDPNKNDLQIICPACNSVKQRGINKRIDDFFNLDEYKTIRDKQDFIASAKKIARTRHKFSHNLEGRSAIEYDNDMIATLGYNTTFYLKEDIKYREGIFQAKGNMKTLNTIILIDKLLNK